VSGSAVRILALVLTFAVGFPALGATEPCEVKAPAPPCVATAATPVAICFGDPPLVIDHCGPEIAPNFAVDIWHAADAPSVGYRYSYQLIVNGRPQRVEAFEDLDNAAAYPFTESPDLAARRLPFSGRTTYALRVTVSAEGLAQQTELSRDVLLEDRPRIRGLAVGISNYANPAFNLNYADADAKAFQAVMTKLLGVTADVRIDRRTSDEHRDMTKDTLLGMIRQVAGDTSGEKDDEDFQALSGPDDWYVFYFSGHGIVGVNRQGEVGRYISTRQFDPANLPRTAIRISDLASALYGTGARNLLVILDSCFSGSHVRPESSSPGPGGRGTRAPTPAEAARRSGKVVYVANGKAGNVWIGGEGDAQVFNSTAVQLDGQRRRGLFLAAASADREAEEGPVSYIRQEGRILLEFSRASVRANADIHDGHGLYTFAWLANLIAQLPKGTDVSTLLAGGRTPAGPGVCELDFDAAASSTKVDIHDLGRERGWDLQIPEARVTTTLPPRIGCVVPLAEEP
jgi:hypothetical protein